MAVHFAGKNAGRRLTTQEPQQEDAALRDVPGIPTGAAGPSNGVTRVGVSEVEEREEKKILMGERLRKANREPSTTKRHAGRRLVVVAGLALFVVVVGAFVVQSFAKCLLRLENRRMESGTFERSAGMRARRLAGPPLRPKLNAERKCVAEAAEASLPVDGRHRGNHRMGPVERGVLKKKLGVDEKRVTRAQRAMMAQRYRLEMRGWSVPDPGVQPPPEPAVPRQFSEERHKDMKEGQELYRSYLHRSYEDLTEIPAEEE